jgi:hypothetical protein
VLDVFVALVLVAAFDALALFDVLELFDTLADELAPFAALLSEKLLPLLAAAYG